MNAEIFERTEMALEMLVQNCLDTQRLRKTDIERYDSLDALNKYGTVKMAGPRMMGHTTSAVTVAKRHFKDIVYVCPTIEQAERLAERFDLDKSSCMSARQVGSKMRGRSLDCVVVDCAFFISTIQMDEIAETACRCMAHSQSKCLMLIQ